MLMIIQFAVINNGAGRVAEVTARFTLDAMPGKQMSIDADLNAGIINEYQAQERRLSVSREANFFGAMDGASKFVKGDAIAAVIVILVNILGGIVIGVLQRGQGIVDALQTYTTLTIGAGLAVQVPALMVSTASGLIVTRSTSDETLGADVIRQVSNFTTLLVSTLIIGVIALIPGLPKLPFLIVGAILAGVTYIVWRAEHKPVEIPGEAVSTVQPLETPEDVMGDGCCRSFGIGSGLWLNSIS